MLWKFNAPSGYTPTLTLYRADNNGLIGSAACTEGPPGFYSGNIAVVGYTGNVLASLVHPSGSLYGSTVDGQLREDPPLPPSGGSTGDPVPVVEIPSGDPDVRAAAADPASIAVDGVSVTNRSVKETIDADRHLSGQNAAAKNNNFGIALRRIIPGSSVGQ